MSTRVFGLLVVFVVAGLASRLAAAEAPAGAALPELHANIALAVKDLAALQQRGDWVGARKRVEGLILSNQSSPYESFFLNNLLWQFTLQDEKNPNAKTEAIVPLQRALALATDNGFATPRELERMVTTSVALTGSVQGRAEAAAIKAQNDAKQRQLALAGITSGSASAVTSFSYVAIVIDTSKSMRDPATGMLSDAVMQAARETLALFPSASSVVVDADGNCITTSSFAWVPNLSTMQNRLLTQLPAYMVESGKDPSIGLVALMQSGWRGSMYICVIGDEWTPPVSDPVAAVAKLNSRNPAGVPAVRIGGIQVPTFGVGTSTPGSRVFQSYMTRIAADTGGGVTVLDANAMRQVSPAAAATLRNYILKLP